MHSLWRIQGRAKWRAYILLRCSIFGATWSQPNRYVGHRAGSAPVFQHGLPIGLLPHPLAHHPLDFCGLGGSCGHGSKLLLQLRLERHHRLVGQEYGMLVLQKKIDHLLVDHVPIDTLEGNGEHIAVLDPAHEAIVTDREDRKWVACALAAQILFGESPAIVYGAETDWHIATMQLEAIGVCFHPLLPNDWYTSRVGTG